MHSKLRLFRQGPLSLAWRVFAAVMALALGACASTVGSERTVFHQWPTGAEERTFRMVRAPGQEESLAHANFEAVVRAELVAAGFRETPDPRFEVGFDFRTREVVARSAYYGPYFTPYFSFGTGGPHSYLGFSAPLSWWAYDRDERRFERRLSLTMRDLRAQPPQRVYEATAVNSGFTPDMTGALPYMMRALLVDFPGQSGSTRWVDVPADSDTAPAS